MTREVQIEKANEAWILRFRYYGYRLRQNPMVLIDRVRLISNGIALLKRKKKIKILESINSFQLKPLSI